MDTITHRGPDDQGMWYDAMESIYIGHRRLSIIDIADGAQPMWTEDENLCVVFNGEIYNHRDLRAELVSYGHRFRTHHSDTEVLLHGYQQWQEQMLQRLNGMWAFAIYDRLKQTIFLSRDRFGENAVGWGRTQ